MLKHDGKTPRHSGWAWEGPWGILWGNFFFTRFWNFENFFFQIALSQPWVAKFFGNLIYYRVDMTLWFDENFFSNFPHFWKFSLISSFSLFDSIWWPYPNVFQNLSVASESSDIISTFDVGLVLYWWLFYIGERTIKVFAARTLLYKVPFFERKIFFSIIDKSSQIWYHEHMQNFGSKSVKTKKFC